MLPNNKSLYHVCPILLLNVDWLFLEGGTTPLGHNTHYNGPFNPYSRQHYSGGSSGGSAVAVATGLVPIAVGFDSGGSIRLPACWSGVYGLATTVCVFYDILDSHL